MNPVFYKNTGNYVFLYVFSRRWKYGQQKKLPEVRYLRELYNLLWTDDYNRQFNFNYQLLAENDLAALDKAVACGAKDVHTVDEVSAVDREIVDAFAEAALVYIEHFVAHVVEHLDRHILRFGNVQTEFSSINERIRISFTELRLAHIVQNSVINFPFALLGRAPVDG